MKNIARAVAKTRFNRRKQKIWNSRRFRRVEKKDRGTQEFSVKVGRSKFFRVFPPVFILLCIYCPLYIQPQTEWDMVEEYDLSSFSKLSTTVPEVEDMSVLLLNRLNIHVRI